MLESEGSHEVCDPKIEDPDITVPLKTKQVNIRTEEEPKYAMVRNYWDDATVEKILLNLKKSTFVIPFGNLLGHVICKKGLMVDPTKIVVILNLQAPQSVKQPHATLGHTGYYRKFIKSYAEITAPMEQLLKKDATYCWNEECNKSLETLKEKMASTPILVFPKWDIEF
eukprot:PITA_19155